MKIRRAREWQGGALAVSFTTTLTTATATALAVAALANEVWLVDAQITAQCSSTGGVAYQVTAPVGAIIEGWVYSSTSALTTLSYQRLTAINTLTSTALHTVATTPAPDVLRFLVTIGSTAGQVAIAAASKTSGQTTTLFVGSAFTAVRVG